MSKDLLQSAIELIARHEGFRSKPYRCPAGKLTIGFGRNLEDKGISREEARILLRNDVLDALRWAIVVAQENQVDFHVLPFTVRLALVDMAFNLGPGGLRSFKRMWKALGRKDWDRAAYEALDSKWAKQVGRRASEVAELIRQAKSSEVMDKDDGYQN